MLVGIPESSGNAEKDAVTQDKGALTPVGRGEGEGRELRV